MEKKILLSIILLTGLSNVYSSFGGFIGTEIEEGINKEEENRKLQEQNNILLKYCGNLSSILNKLIINQIDPNRQVQNNGFFIIHRDRDRDRVREGFYNHIGRTAFELIQNFTETIRENNSKIQENNKI